MSDERADRLAELVDRYGEELEDARFLLVLMQRLAIKRERMAKQVYHPEDAFLNLRLAVEEVSGRVGAYAAIIGTVRAVQRAAADAEAPADMNGFQQRTLALARATLAEIHESLTNVANVVDRALEIHDRWVSRGCDVLPAMPALPPLRVQPTHPGNQEGE